MDEEAGFRLTKVHIRRLRGIEALDLPEDGLGWGGAFPPVCVIAGANGSGKTTLLRCIVAAARVLAGELKEQPPDLDAEACLLAFASGDTRVWFEVGERVLRRNWPGFTMGFLTLGRPGVSQLIYKKSEVEPKRRRPMPRVVFLPSEDRDLIVPDVEYKAPGRLEADDIPAVSVWQRLGSKQWAGSTIELLFSARWADLNAKEEGHPDEANHFASYADAFADLTGRRKALAWTRHGDLVVRLADGTTHGVADLSSGERQALLLLAELRRRWRPGSLVLVDELELHLHDAWQARLLDVIRAMQRERGGQVIITTQSHSLFEMAEQGTRALLGRGRLR